MLVRVSVITEAKKEVIKEVSEGKLTISLKLPAERNQANKRIRELLAEWYNVPVGLIRIMTGHKSPHKVIEVLLE